MKKIELSYDKVYDLYINQGLSFKEVAQILSVSTMVVCRFAKANGITKSGDELKEQRERTIEKKYGVKNAMQNKQVQQKAQETYKKRTGYDNPGKNPEVWEKIRSTNKELYGDEVATRSDVVKEKTKQTNLERYGVENVFSLSEVKEAIKGSFMERYGKSNPMQAEEIKSKVKLTNKERYGEEWGLQNKEVREKGRLACLEKYGTEHPASLPEIKEKSKATCRERYGADYYCQSESYLSKSDRFLMQTEGRRDFLYTPNLSEKAKEVFSNKDSFSNFVLGIPEENRNTKTISSLIECSQTTVARVVTAYDLWYLLPHNHSVPEMEIVHFLEEMGVNGAHSRKVVSPFEIDIYCPEYGVGIEYNGDYWHQEEKVGRRYHLDKMKLAEERGVFLYQIFEHEWIIPETQKKIKSQLRNIFGKNERCIYARKCEIREVGFSEKNDFLEAYHLQGSDLANVSYGLYYKGELVSVMTFKKPYFNHNFDWELSRFCNKDNTTVVGGASRLFKHFLKEHSGTIISYSNNCKTRGSVYEVLGFHREKDSPPGFVYTNGAGVTLSRHQSRSEEGKRIIKDLKLFKVWDCGNKVWTYEKN